MKEDIIQNPEMIAKISNAVTNNLYEILAKEAFRWGSFLVMGLVFLILIWYLIREATKAKTENVIITYDISEMRETNLLAKKEYLLNIEVLKQDLYKQAEEIRENYSKNLEEFKYKLVKELNIDNDVLEAYKEFYKIKSLVFQDLEHQDLKLEAVLPVIYLRLHKTHKRLYDFDKTYGYILPKQIAEALSALMKHCNNGINKDDIKSNNFNSTSTFVNSLENLNNKFRTYLNLK